jgi:hypothetical protein
MACSHQSVARLMHQILYCLVDLSGILMRNKKRTVAKRRGDTLCLVPRKLRVSGGDIPSHTAARVGNRELVNGLVDGSVAGESRGLIRRLSRRIQASREVGS